MKRLLGALTALILLAQLLSSLKKWECWIVWLLVGYMQVNNVCIWMINNANY